MSFCTQCGKLLMDGQACECTEEIRFCTQCGTQLFKGQVCACTIAPTAEPVPEPAHTVDITPQPVVEPRNINIVQPVPEPQPPAPAIVEPPADTNIYAQEPAAAEEIEEIEEVEEEAEYPDEATEVEAAEIPAGAQEDSMLIVPGYVAPIADEVPIRQYNIATLRNLFRINRGAGYLQVTNKRIIYRSDGRSIGGGALVHHEFNIDEISGLEAVSIHRFSFTHLVIGLMTIGLGAALMMMITLAFSNWFSAVPGQAALSTIRATMEWTFYDFFAGREQDINQISLLVGLVIGFGGITLFFVLRRMFWFKLVMLGLGLGGFTAVALTGNVYAYILLMVSVLMNILGLVLFSVVPDLVIAVRSCGNRLSLVRARRSLAAIFQGHSAASAGYAEVAPTAETEAAIQELGAIIADINSLGEAGVERWSF